MTSATAMADSVKWRTSPNRATSRNQSPQGDQGRHVEPSEVAVSAKQGDAGPKASLHLDGFAR